jgi:hypothetical protein
VECYNGVFISPAEIPPAEACVDPVNCDLTEFTGLRSYLKTDANMSAIINHGDSVDFYCKENRTLAAAKDPDSDNIFKVECVNGVMTKTLLWPEETEVKKEIPERFQFQFCSRVLSIIVSCGMYILGCSCSAGVRCCSKSY